MKKKSYEDIYEIIDVTDGKNIDEIEKQINKKIKKYHPDKIENTDIFKDLKLIKSILLTERKKEKYDNLGHEKYIKQEMEESFNYFEFTQINDNAQSLIKTNTDKLSKPYKKPEQNKSIQKHPVKRTEIPDSFTLKLYNFIFNNKLLILIVLIIFIMAFLYF